MSSSGSHRETKKQQQIYYPPKNGYNSSSSSSNNTTHDTHPHQHGSGSTGVDYVIVGVGTAGSALCRILSDDGETSVLGLEAGGNNDYDQPIVDSTMSMELHENYHNQYFWDGESVPQTFVNNRSFDYTGGRLLGGSSSINGQQFVRGHAAYTEWFEKTGRDKDWSPENVAKVLTRFETYHGITNPHTKRGKHGLVDIRQAPSPSQPASSMAQKFVNAITKSTGLPEILDYNDPATPIGPFTRWQLYQHANGSRVSGSIAYLDDIVKQVKSGSAGAVNSLIPKDGSSRKLCILIKATVMQILWSGGDNATDLKQRMPRACGVSYLHNGKSCKVMARKGVIVCAGVHSPALLLRSGIGPKEDLKKAGIPLIYHNSNVGTNLYNHLVLTVKVSANPKDVGVPDQDANALYVGGAFLPQPLPRPPTTTQASSASPIADAKSSGNNTRRAVELIGMSAARGELSILILPLVPRSTGTIRIQDSDPLKQPLIDHRYLSDPVDLQHILYDIRHVRDIVDKFSDPLYKLTSPDPGIVDDDEKLSEFVKETMSLTHHWTSSLSMGCSPRDAVVSAGGQVFGVDGLYVADCCIAPVPHDGNTSSAAFVIAHVIGNKLLRQKS